MYCQWLSLVAGLIGIFLDLWQPKFHFPWHWDSSQCYSVELNWCHWMRPGFLQLLGTFWMFLVWEVFTHWSWEKIMLLTNLEWCKTKWQCRYLYKIILQLHIIDYPYLKWARADRPLTCHFSLSHTKSFYRVSHLILRKSKCLHHHQMLLGNIYKMH